MRRQVLGRARALYFRGCWGLGGEPGSCLLWMGWMPACVCVAQQSLAHPAHGHFHLETLLSSPLHPDPELGNLDLPATCQPHCGLSVSGLLGT